MSIQEALKLLRFELGMTQTDLAEKLQKAYITVNRWENGKGFPSRKNSIDLLNVAKKYNASENCISYLTDVLMPESKRNLPASAYGFPDVERDFLFQLADESANSIYVIEAGTYNLLYANRMAEKSAVRFLNDTEQYKTINERRLIDQKDKRCFHYFSNKNEPCSFCPFKEIKNKNFIKKILVIPDTNRTLSIRAKKAKMKNKDVYIIYLTDITDEDTKLNALYELTNDIPQGVGIYKVKKDFSIELVFLNTILFRMIGNERKEDILNHNLSSYGIIHPDDKEILYKEIRNSAENNIKISMDLRMKIEDGYYHNVNLSARIIRQDEDSYTYYCLFNKNERCGNEY